MILNSFWSVCCEKHIAEVGKMVSDGELAIISVYSQRGDRSFALNYTASGHHEYPPFKSHLSDWCRNQGWRHSRQRRLLVQLLLQFVDCPERHFEQSAKLCGHQYNVRMFLHLFHLQLCILQLSNAGQNESVQNAGLRGNPEDNLQEDMQLLWCQQMLIDK